MTNVEHSLIPEGDIDSYEYWQNIRDKQLSAPHCIDCGEWTFFPRLMCVSCGSRNTVVEPLSGRGVIYSYTVVHRTASEHWGEHVPYVVGLIDLIEGPRMMADVRASLDEVAVGKAVEVSFDGPHGGLPGFVVSAE